METEKLRAHGLRWQLLEVGLELVCINSSVHFYQHVKVLQLFVAWMFSDLLVMNMDPFADNIF